MKVQRLACTQRSFTMGSPCSVIAAFTGLAFLQAEPDDPTARQLEHRLRMACTTWAILVSPTRGKHVPSDALTVNEVLSAVVDSDTGAAPWVHHLEMTGLHMPAGRTPAAALAALADLGPPSAGVVEFMSVASMLDALHEAERRATAGRRSLAITVTYGGHTVVVAFVVNDFGYCASALDSLTGQWLTGDGADAIHTLLGHVVTAWFPPTEDVDAALFTANVFSRADAPAPTPTP